ncbi:MAG TPA: MFS transporter [Candidatus Dormibacteraeota bacterium]|nr:MFS transporter [Candidatus Dormibacteraeota bacterium]
MRSDFRRWAALVVVCLGQLMIMLDTTIVNVALPYIQRDLHFSQANLTWIVNAYLIAFGSLLLLAGRIGDLVGRRKVFLAGVFLFTVASVGAGLAPGAGNLITARFLQGVGASLSAGVILAIIITEFQKPAERAQAMSMFTLVIAGGGSLGLLAGGLLTQFVNWHWIFFINLPVGIATMVLGAWLIEENEGLGLSQGVDVAGAALVTAALMVGVYAIVTAADFGWSSWHTLGFGGAALVLLAVFAAIQRRIANPIMPPRVLAIRSLTGASAVRALVFTGISTSFFIGVLYLQHVRGFTAFGTGLAFLPTTVTLGVLSAGITARLMARVGPRNLLLVGMTTIIGAFSLFALASDQTSYFPQLLAGYGLLGLGGGMTFLPLLTIAMSEAPVADAGVASGFSNQVQQVGGALGLAVIGSVSTSYSLDFLLAAASVAAGLGIVVGVLRPSRARTRPQPVRAEVAESEAA